MLVGLTGCSQSNQGWFRDRGLDYHHSAITSHLEVPEDLDSIPQNRRFPVPLDVDPNAPAPSIVPPGL